MINLSGRFYNTNQYLFRFSGGLLKIINHTRLIVLCSWVAVGLLSTAFGAKPQFRSYELESGYNKPLFFDFDGNGLDDIIIINEPNLVFFFQDTENGFTKAANLVYSLENKPSVIWPAKLGDNPGQNILVMTHEGVSMLSCINKTLPPEKKNIITRQTVIPEKCENSPIFFFKLSADTTGDFPFLLIPNESKLEIWKHHNKSWQQISTLADIPQESAWGPSTTIGYIYQYELNMNVADVNGDALEDLLVCEDNHRGDVVYKMCLQSPKDTFVSGMSRIFEDQWDWRTWIRFQDINKDGHVDVIKSNWLREPGFIPGADSGKVVVQIFLADSNGNVPEKAQYVFRKSDWTPSVPIVDIDNDGYVDMVLGYGQFDSREGIRKAITSKKLDHTLRFHFYNGSGFDQKADFEREISVYLDYRGPVFTSRFGRVEDRMSLDGDFDGDGYKDLLVKDNADKISVYSFISRKKGFSKKANNHFNAKKVHRLIIEDLNNDGISDLVVIGYKITVFLSEKR